MVSFVVAVVAAAAAAAAAVAVAAVAVAAVAAAVVVASVHFLVGADLQSDPRPLNFAYYVQFAMYSFS